MARTASRLRFKLAGVAVTALLMVSPVLSHQVSAQGSSDIDPDAAEALLSEAEDLTTGVDPMVDGDSLTVTQDADSISVSFLNDEGDLVGDFYLEYTVEAPEDADTDPFDFGSVVRYVEDQSDLRIIFKSDDGSGDPAWYFAEGTDTKLSDNLDPDVFDVTPGSTYDIVIAAIGDEAAFSINGEPLAILDISDFSDPGDMIVGTGFFEDATVADRDVEFTDITLYNLDDAESNGQGEEEETPTEEATEENGGGGETEGRGEEETPTEEATEEATEETTGEGDTYESPTYGYSLEYDDTWAPSEFTNRDNPATGVDLSSEGVDITDADSIILGNGTSSVAVYGGESTATPEDCVQGDIAFFENNDVFEFFSVAKDTDGNDLEGETTDGDGYYAVVWVTNVSDEDNPIDTTVYIECRPIVDGESLLLIEHYAADADYNDQIDAREALLAGLEISGSGPADVTPEVDETPEEDVTPEEDETPTEEASGGDIEVTLDAVGTSDVEGEAVISSSGTTRSTIDVVAPTAPEGSLVIVQEGSCDDLSGEADFEAGSIDENGESSDRIRITPDELDGNYALTIVDADTEDYAEPLACGDIG